MSSQTPITMSTAEAQNHISQDLRNNIYSALLSGDGIRNIEASLDRQLAESGFKDELRRYVTDLFRSGQASTVDEARALAMERIKNQMQGDDGQSNGVSSADSFNGVNGHDEQYDLKIPNKAIVEGTKTVRKELEKVDAAGGSQEQFEDRELATALTAALREVEDVQTGDVTEEMDPILWHILNNIDNYLPPSSYQPPDGPIQFDSAPSPAVQPFGAPADTSFIYEPIRDSHGPQLPDPALSQDYHPDGIPYDSQFAFEPTQMPDGFQQPLALSLPGLQPAAAPHYPILIFEPVQHPHGIQYFHPVAPNQHLLDNYGNLPPYAYHMYQAPTRRRPDRPPALMWTCPTSDCLLCYKQGLTCKREDENGQPCTDLEGRPSCTNCVARNEEHCREILREDWYYLSNRCQQCKRDGLNGRSCRRERPCDRCERYGWADECE